MTEENTTKKAPVRKAPARKAQSKTAAKSTAKKDTAQPQAEATPAVGPDTSAETASSSAPQGPATLKVDDKEYLIDDLSDRAKQTLQALRFTETEIQRLKNLQSMAQTARVGYLQVLKNELDALPEKAAGQPH